MAELQRNAGTMEIADYMNQIMPAATIPQPSTADIQLPKPKAKSGRGTQTHVMTAFVATADTHIQPSKRLYKRRQNVNLSERRMMKMIMTMSFSRRTQRGLVEKMLAL